MRAQGMPGPSNSQIRTHSRDIQADRARSQIPPVRTTNDTWGTWQGTDQDLGKPAGWYQDGWGVWVQGRGKGSGKRTGKGPGKGTRPGFGKH